METTEKVNDIRQVAEITWGRVAIKRLEWRTLDEAFATWQTANPEVEKERNHNIK